MPLVTLGGPVSANRKVRVKFAPAEIFGLVAEDGTLWATHLNVEKAMAVAETSRMARFRVVKYVRARRRDQP